MTNTSTFKVGDKVTHRSFGEGEIAFGPYESVTGDDYYLMVNAKGAHCTVIPEALTARTAFSVGDKAVGTVSGRTHEILAGPFSGNDGPWYVTRLDGSDIDATNREANLTPAERATTYTYDGVTYDLTAQYRDPAGDVWEFSRTEVSRCGTPDNQSDATPLARWRDGDYTEFTNGWAWSLAQAVRIEGPLIRV